MHCGSESKTLASGSSGKSRLFSFIVLISDATFGLLSIYSLISGGISLDQISGPLGIANVAGQTAKEGGIIALIIRNILII